MTFVDAVRSVLSKYADFTGRARRSEYWWFALFNAILSVVASMLDRAIFDMTLLQAVVVLALLLPGLAVGVRRLHDTGRSGWWLLIALTCVGVIALIVFFVQDSQPGSNQYGPSPKGDAAVV